METQLGLDRNQTAQVLKVVARTRPKLKEAVASYQDMLENGTQVKDINELIRAAKNVSQKLGNPLPTNVPQNVINATQDVKRQTGIEGNAKRIEQLREEAANDADISPNDRALINKALDVLALPLGTEPVAAEAILEEAIGRSENPEKVKKYIEPYIERVRLQQKKPLSNRT